MAASFSQAAAALVNHSMTAEIFDLLRNPLHSPAFFHQQD